MPWDLKITSSAPDQSLGDLKSVQSKLQSALPGIGFGRDASGAEKVQAMEQAGRPVPDFLREIWRSSPGQFLGTVEASNICMDFIFGVDETSVREIIVEVRGSGDPMPLIHRLQCMPGWKLLDGYGNAPSRDAWDQFSKLVTDATKECRQ